MQDFEYIRGGKTCRSVNLWAHARIYPILAPIDRRFWVRRVSAGQRRRAESADRNGAIVISLVQAYQAGRTLRKSTSSLLFAGRFALRAQPDFRRSASGLFLSRLKGSGSPSWTGLHVRREGKSSCAPDHTQCCNPSRPWVIRGLQRCG